MELDRLSGLLRDPAPRRAFLLFVMSAVLAIYIAYVTVSPAVAERLIVNGGYYYILGVFASWIFFGWRIASDRRSTWTPWLRHPGFVGLFLIVAIAFAVWTDEFAHKVLFDEYVLQGTAWHMHRTKEIGAPMRAFEFAGTWMAIDTFLDKRPYFFTFLVSLLHDLIGFRIANVYVLNVAVGFSVLGATFWLVRALTLRVTPALLAVAMLATLPLFGQNATGASMELLNLAMIAVTMTAAVLYLRAPDDLRLSFLVLGAVLLAQTRYESVLFVFPVAGVIVLGWMRAGRLILPWPAMVAPLLLAPYVWHDRYVNAKPILWQLREGEATRFAWQYLTGNLEGARTFFFSISPGQPNSLWLTLTGLGGLVCAAIYGLKALRKRGARPRRFLPEVVVLVLFGLTIAANLGMLMFYYWSRLDEPIASRFALPSYFILAVAAGWLAHALDLRRFPATRLIGGGLAVWLLVFGAPAYAHRLYTAQNMVMRELDWEMEQVIQRPRPILLMTSKATLPFLMRKISAMNTVMAGPRAPQIAWHMRQGTFREVIVSQVLRPISADGDAIVDPNDEVPDNFRLQTIAEKRFGGRWIRVSRLMEIVPVNGDAEVPGPGSAEAPK